MSDAENESAPPKPPRRLGRLLLRVAAGLVVLLLVLAVGAWFLLPSIDLAALAANRLSARLGRETTVGSLHVTPGRVLRLEVSDVKVANVAWGTEPMLYAVRRVVAEVDALSLLRGPTVVRTVEIDGLAVFLEHGPGHQPNWRDGPAKPPSNDYRRSFPSIRAMAAKDTRVTVKTTSGKELVTALATVTLQSDDDGAPVKLAAAGTQAGVPVTLDADLHSFREFHDPATPFGADLRLTAPNTGIQFVGTFTDPLSVDGAAGELTLDAATMAPLLQAGGGSGADDVELHLVGTLRRHDNDWALTDATGALWDGAITRANLHILEGTPGQSPDKVDVDADLDLLELKPPLPPQKNTPRRQATDTSLVSEGPADTEVHAKLKADTMAFGDITATDASFEAALAGDKLAVSTLALTIYGARVQGSGSLVRGHDGGKLEANLSASAADVQTVRRAVGLRSLPLAGRLEGRVLAEAAGRTLNAALAQSRIGAVLWMRGGVVAREVIEMLSTDVRALFRTSRGMEPVSCLLAGVDLRGLSGTVSPLRIRAATGTIGGYGRVDLNRKTLDVTIASEGRTTGALALDVPIRISGSFASPDVRPAGRGALAASENIEQLPPAIREEAARHPCGR